MNIFAIIASLINKLLNFSLFPDVALPDVTLPGEEQKETRRDENKTEYDDFKERGEQNKGRCLLTRPENVNPNARFFSTGSPAWVNQWAGLVIDGTDMHGRHGGTDYLGPEGTEVFAPFAMTIVRIGHYSDSGRWGDYVIGNVGDLEFYSGHLKNVQVKTGQQVQCGDKLGEMNAYNHTHIQTKRNGQLVDPESILQ